MTVCSPCTGERVLQIPWSLGADQPQRHISYMGSPEENSTEFGIRCVLLTLRARQASLRQRAKPRGHPARTFHFDGSVGASQKLTPLAYRRWC
jgi:hypothetical protein